MLILWDIDQTLIEAGRLDRQIWATIASDLADTRRVPIEVVQGSTISTILRAALMRHGVSAERADELLPMALAAEVTALSDAEKLRGTGRALPGAHASLAHLASFDRPIVQSILTGNQQDSARLKLHAFGLLEHVDLAAGAYGSDAEERPALVPIARQRTSSRYGAGQESPTVLIGDSVRDVAAAHRNDAAVIAVCSGSTTASELAEAGADAVLPDLVDVDALVSALEHVTGERLRMTQGYVPHVRFSPDPTPRQGTS